MLVRCPRCGFSQPKDQYCAQCGVDMEKFRPPKSSLHKRILFHPGTWVGVVLLSFLMSYNLFKANRLAGQRKTSSAQGFVRVQGARDASEAAPIADKPPAPLVAKKLSASAENKKVDTKKTISDGSQRALEKVNEIALDLSFYEVRLTHLNEWLERSNIPEAFQHYEEYSVAKIPNFSKLKKSLLDGAKSLNHASEKVTEVSRQVDLFLGERTRSRGVGSLGHRYFLRIKPELRSTQIAGEMFIQLFFPGPGEASLESLNESIIQMSFELDPDSALVLIGGTPRELSAQALGVLAHKPVYRIYESEDFQKKLSDLMFILEWNALRNATKVDSKSTM